MDIYVAIEKFTGRDLNKEYLFLQKVMRGFLEGYTDSGILFVELLARLVNSNTPKIIYIPAVAFDRVFKLKEHNIESTPDEVQFGGLLNGSSLESHVFLIEDLIHKLPLHCGQGLITLGFLLKAYSGPESCSLNRLAPTLKKGASLLKL